MKSKKQKVYIELLLHDIRSVQNVASIFRLADCIGVAKIILSGVSPSPFDRFNRVREDFKKISLGAEEFVNWQKIGEEPQTQDKKLVEKIDKENLEKAKIYISEFKNKYKKNAVIIALEQDKKSVDYKKIKINKNKKYLIIPGREAEGLTEELLNLVDKIIEIPQYGKKESLNIFSSLSIALYRLFDI